MKASLIKNYRIIGIVVVLILLGGVVWYISANRAPSFSTVAAAQGNVIQSVDEAATVQAENSVDLSFTAPGQITSVPVSEGDVVGAGAILATLDQSALQAGVQQANAAVAAAQAKLDSIMNGTRPEQMQIYQSAVMSAQAGLSASVGSAYSASDDAIHNQTDNFFTSPRSSNPVFLVSVTDSQMLNNIASERVVLEGTLNGWYSAMATSSTSGNLSALSPIADKALAQIKSYLDTVALAINNATPSGAVTPTVIAGYKVNIVTARAEVIAAINALTAAETAYTGAQNTLALAQAGSTAQDVEVQKAAVLQAQAAATTAQVALDHASIKAPFGGTVRNLTAKIGQIASPGVPVVSLTNNAGLKIIAYVSATDVAKIAVNDKTNVTLDAYNTDKLFPATVTTIDSAPTQVNGTTAYKVTMHFITPDATIKDGMTGNVHIIVAEHDNVVTVPSRLVVNDGSGSFVLVAGTNGTERRPVQVGISGDDGNTEIVSGLSAGDHLTNF